MLVEECAVLEFGQPMLLRARTTVDVVSGICLGDEYLTLRVHGDPVEEGAQGVDGLDQFVRLRVEYEEVTVRHPRVFDDV